jgi:hypothetical protein
MKLDTRTRANALADYWRVTHNVKRADRLDEENDRLRTELRMTTSQLEHERDRQQDVLDVEPSVRAEDQGHRQAAGVCCA